MGRPLEWPLDLGPVISTEASTEAEYSFEVVDSSGAEDVWVKKIAHLSDLATIVSSPDLKEAASSGRRFRILETKTTTAVVVTELIDTSKH